MTWHIQDNESDDWFSVFLDSIDGRVASSWEVIENRDHPSFVLIAVQVTPPNSWDDEKLDQSLSVVLTALNGDLSINPPEE